MPDPDEPHAAERDRLRREALRYEALLTADGAIIWVVDAELRPTGKNEAWKAYTGQAVGRETGLNWLDSVHPDDHHQVRTAAADASRSGRPLALQLRIRRADGAWRRHLIRAIPIREQGIIVEWIGTATDVEDDLRLADEQRDLRGRLLALTDGAEALLSTRSLAAARASVLDLAERVLPGDASAIWWHDPIGSEWRVVAARGLGDRFVADRLPGGVVPFAHPLDVSDVGTLPVLDSRHDAYAAEGVRSLLAIPLPIGGARVGTLVIYYRTPHEATDTERRMGVALGQMAAAALWNAETYEALTRANEAKDDFLAILSHELRTPLNAIMGWSHMLRDGLPADLTTHAIEVISRNARAQKQLIEDLLDVARIANGRLDLSSRPVDLVEIGRVAVDSALPTARAADITLAFEAPQHAVLVDGDVDRLQQVAANLLSNALKFSDRGGRISVRIDEVDGVHLVVSDTGAGIAPDFLPFVFERFTQHDTSLSRPYSGLGLGLWVVRQIVEAHRGTARAESEGPGRGTTIVVTLPPAS